MPEDNTITLEMLGWREEFANYYLTLKRSELIPARIAVQYRDRLPYPHYTGRNDGRSHREIYQPGKAWS